MQTQPKSTFLTQGSVKGMSLRGHMSAAMGPEIMSGCTYAVPNSHITYLEQMCALLFKNKYIYLFFYGCSRLSKMVLRKLLLIYTQWQGDSPCPFLLQSSQLYRLS